MSDRNYGALREASSVEKFVAKLLKDGKPFAFDIEAGYDGADEEKVSLKQFHPKYKLVGISFTNDPNWARYVPIAHDDGNNVDDEIRTARAFWRLLQSGLGIAHNITYELKGMSRWFRKVLWNDPEVGAEVRASKGLFPFLSDTLLLVWLSAEYEPAISEVTMKDLKEVSKRAFGLIMTQFMSLFPLEDTDLGPAMKKGKGRFVRFNTRNSMNPQVISYACEDSVASLLLYFKHIGLHKEFITKVEMDLVPVLVEMEMGPVDPETGEPEGNMLFDWGLVQRKADEVEQFRDRYAEELQADLSERLGRPININLNSPAQLAKVLFEPAPEGLGLPISEKHRSEKTGAPSTGDDALRVIAKRDPIIQNILTYRQIAKVWSAYLNKFVVDLMYSGTGYVFPNHNQAGTLTGRMSVDGVSYQQWPKYYLFKLKDGTEFRLNFRDIFKAPKGFRIMGFDYSQVELRVLASVSHEKAMLEAFAAGIDIHKATASTMLRIPLEEITKALRGVGKTSNFAVVYQSGAQNIADMLTAQGSPTTLEEAEEMLEKYYAAFPDLRNWMNTRIAEGHEQGYVRTPFGRKFTVWEFLSPKRWIRAKGDRMCVNAPIQGGAADYMKIALVRAYKVLKEQGLLDKIRMTLTIHDALELLVHESLSDQYVIDLLTPCVSFPVAFFPIDIRADWHVGQRWGHVVEIKTTKDYQITHYEIEDVDVKFDTVDEAIAYWEKKDAAALLPKPVEEPQKAPEKPQEPVWEDSGFTDGNHTFESYEPGVEDGPEYCRGCGAHYSSPLHGPTGVAPADERMAIITMVDMPDEAQWADFQEWLAEHPGTQKIRVEMPEGSLDLDTTHAVSRLDQGVLSLILGGASVAFVSEDINVTDFEVAL